MTTFRHWLDLVETWAADPLSDPHFRQWFGKSVVRDETGRPLRVYHGTSSRHFDSFHSDSGMIFFSTSPEFANGYAMSTLGHDRARVIPCYLRIERPFDFRTDRGHNIALAFYGHHVTYGRGLDRHTNRLIRISLYGRADVEDEDNPDIHEDQLSRDEWMQAIEVGAFPALEDYSFQEWIRYRAKCDGMIVAENGALNYVVFSPTQIKSAISNTGSFNRRSTQIDH